MLQCLSEILLIDLAEVLRVFGIEPKGQQYRVKWLSEDGLRSWHGEPNVITSTGSISAPFIFVISPKCFMAHHLLISKHYAALVLQHVLDVLPLDASFIDLFCQLH